MSTKRQSWALFCITKKDYRNENLTYDEASKLINELGDPNYIKKIRTKDDNDTVRITKEAFEAGITAMKGTTPIPMVVQQHTNMLDDKSPVTQSWVINDGVCGFAWINFKANNTPNRKFLAGLKKAGMVGEHNQWSKDISGGYTYWVSDGGQSMTRKEVFAHAYVQVLQNNGITAYVHSRID